MLMISVLSFAIDKSLRWSNFAPKFYLQKMCTHFLFCFHIDRFLHPDYFNNIRFNDLEQMSTWSTSEKKHLFVHNVYILIGAASSIQITCSVYFRMHSLGRGPPDTKLWCETICFRIDKMADGELSHTHAHA